MISKRTKDALAAAKKRGTVLGGNRGVTPSAKMHKASRAAIQARVDRPDHQSAAGGRRYVTAGHRRRVERSRHSDRAWERTCSGVASTPLDHTTGRLRAALLIECIPNMSHVRQMPHFDTCLGILRRLIAKGDMNGIPLAERAVNEYLDATPLKARSSGLRFLQEDVLTQRDAVLGNQRRFADSVNDYIEKMLRGE